MNLLAPPPLPANANAYNVPEMAFPLKIEKSLLRQKCRKGYCKNI